MSYRIAITGKGGVGKTTMAGLVVLRLVQRGCRPVLAVDADPNTCLDAALGVKVAKSIGSVREEARTIAGKGMSSGVSKQELLELKIAESLVESDDFDLIAMGRPEGPGCYCYANNVLKETLSQISSHYPYVVLDNEAGLENLSRRIVQKVDLLVMVSDPSRRSLDTLDRLYKLAQEMGVSYERLAVIINRLHSDVIPEWASELEVTAKADFVFKFLEDPCLAEHVQRDPCLKNLPEKNRVLDAVDALLDKIGLHKPKTLENGKRAKID
ncbi:MAG: AAA family ATPase [Pseudomonadota bacterium]